MRFLADENFPRAAVTALQAAGRDVSWVRLATPGAADADVLAAAARESRILLTFDKDFGELAARSALLPAAGSCSFAFQRHGPIGQESVSPPGSRRVTIGAVIFPSSSQAV